MQETQTFSVEKIELTPNPRSVKFILNQTVLDEGSKTIEEGGLQEVDTFAYNMFALDIVDMVYLRENFVSVTLTSADLWVIFKDKVKNIIEADIDDASKCRVNNTYGGRCMSNDNLHSLNYPKFK